MSDHDALPHNTRLTGHTLHAPASPVATPRTDERIGELVIEAGSFQSMYYAAMDYWNQMSEFARQLERELAEARRDAAVGRVVYRFIDRMRDVCETDPAERILAEFVTAATPFIDAAIDAAMSQEGR